MENDLGTQLVKYYEEWEDNTITYRKRAERNRDYYSNSQWTSEEEKALNERNQPIVTMNLLKRTLDALLGLERENRTDPKALPRTPTHQKDAEAMTDAIRFVCDNNDFDQIASSAFGNLLVEGIEGCDIQVVRKNGRFEIVKTHVNWDRMFWDVHSRRLDFSDAKYKGLVIWMDYDDAKDRGKREKWDLDKLEVAMTTQENPHNETHSDKPEYKWNDHKRKRVKIAYIHYKDGGKWHWAYFTKAGVLKGGQEIPYVDEFKIPQSTLEFQSAFIDRDGNRFAYTDSLISPQDEVNKRRSKALHLISVRQTFGNQKAGIDKEQVRQEMAKPDGHIDIQTGEYGKDFGRIPTDDMAQGNMAMLSEAKDMFNNIGANTSVTGVEDRVMSGRAEIVRQQAGMREFAPVMDAHTSWKKRIYRHDANLIRQYWDGERWVRVTDDESNMRFVPINRPVKRGEIVEERLREQQDVRGLQRLQQMRQFQIDPRLEEVVGIQNPVASMETDIIIEESPNIANIQEEERAFLLELARMSDAVPFEALVEASPLRQNKKDQIRESIQGNQQSQQQAAQIQQRQVQIDQMEQLGEIDERAAKTDKTEAETLKIMNEVRTGV